MSRTVAEEAIERVYREHSTQIWRGIYAYAGGREDIADDSVAEAFAQALVHSGRIEAPLPWLYRVAFRQAARTLRKEAPLGRPSVEPEDLSAELDHRPGSLGALAFLPDNQRAIVFLYYYADMSIGEIARARDISAVNVRVQLHRARQTLRRQYPNAAAMIDGSGPQSGGDHYGRVA